jgi:serine/threonine protein kinase/Tfp pilus assembly protein PilF
VPWAKELPDSSSNSFDKGAGDGAGTRGTATRIFWKPKCNQASILALRVSELLRGDIAMPGWDPEVNDLFLRAQEMPAPEDRQRFLDEACAGKPELRVRVEGLLRAGAEAGSFLERPAEELGATGASAPGPRDERTSLPRENPGAVVGPYKLLELVGEGGMGTVWMADQTEPIQRRVALKVVKEGMDSRQVLARFEAERQALALMDHPNIAKVLDAGRTPSGRPYFVMELVKGKPITSYCDEKHLGVPERLKLFGEVCRAVQHAHQKGIIHRDLKPSNVLVAPYDGKPVVKVIDFGVAKATGQRLTDKTLFTGFGALVGTPEYMSPEQAEVNNQDIDTRSDIYSLGVLLYELLTGSTPLTRKRLKEAALLEVLRVIREEEPPRPSTRLSESKDSLPSISAQRQTEPAKLTKLVRGELDWIVMKALEKDRNRRYETANGLVMDVERYLADEPVQACPPSAAYRFRKFVRRNKAALVTAGLVAAALVAGTVVSTWQAVRATEAERLAETRLEAETAARRQAVGNLQKARDAVDQLLTKVSEIDLARVPQMESVRRALLEKALRFYQGLLQEHAADPAIWLETAEAYRRMGNIYSQLGQPPKAEQAYGEALGLLDKLAAEFPSEPGYREALAHTNHDLGETLVHLARTAEAEKPMQRAVDLMRGLAAEFPSNTKYRQDQVTFQADLSEVLQILGRLDAEPMSEQAYRQALQLQEKRLADAPNDPVVRYALAYLQVRFGMFLKNAQPKEAEKLYREAIVHNRRLEADFPHTTQYRAGLAEALHYLANLLWRAGRPREAEPLYAEVVAHREKLVTEAPSRPSYKKVLATANSDWGMVLTDLGRWAKAEEVLRRAIGLYEELAKQFGMDRPNLDLRPHLANAQRRLVPVLQATGRLPEAVRLLRQEVERYEKQMGSEPSAAQRRQLASLLQDLSRLPADRLEEAEPYYRRQIALWERLVADFPNRPEDREQIGHSHRVWGGRVGRAGRLSEAEQAYRAALGAFEQLSASFPEVPDHWHYLADTHRILGGILATSKRLPEAEKAYRRAVELQDKCVARFPDQPVYAAERAASYFDLARLLTDAGQAKEVEDLYRKGLQLQPTNALAHNNLAWMLAVAPDPKVRAPARALELAQKAVALAPKVGTFWNTLGVAHYRAGEWKGAVAAFDKSMELRAGGDAFDWFFLAMSHRKLGDPSEARKWFDRAVDWMNKNGPSLRNNPHLGEELRGFRSEAEDLLELRKK